MGQKSHPIGLRLGINKQAHSKWFASKNYVLWLHEDIKLRELVKKRMYSAGISSVDVERAADRIKVAVHTSRPGIVIGKKGVGIDALKNELQQIAKKEVLINIHEVRKAELDAVLVAENVALQLERRVAFRRAMKKAVQTTMKFGAQGIRLGCKGRLGGADMARHEWYREGRVPLHTLRADIDYGFAEAKTTYGIIGVKCWIFKGEVLGEREVEVKPPRRA